MDSTIALGARVLIRGEEWLVRRADPCSDGGDLPVCDGVSELVRDSSAQFLTSLKGHADVLDPAECALVANGSNAFNASTKYIDLSHKGGRKEPATDITIPDGKQQRGNHGWDDIKDAPAGTVIEQTVTDDTLPNGPHQKVRRYEAPFTLANREDDYRIAWEFFAQPAGKGMDVAARDGRRS